MMLSPAFEGICYQLINGKYTAACAHHATSTYTLTSSFSQARRDDSQGHTRSSAMGNQGSRVNSTAVGVAVGFCILAILFTIAIVQFCYKYKCNSCKNCCKKKKPPLTDRVLTSVGLKKKSSSPFTISGSKK